MFTPLKTVNRTVIASEWGVMPRLPVSQNFVFFFEHQNKKKVRFLGRIYSIYMNEDITPPTLGFSVS
jgi:hypothetical protein